MFHLRHAVQGNNVYIYNKRRKLTVETARTTFDANSLPWKTYGYGKLQQELGYTLTAGAQAGTLHTVKDGRGQVTTLSDWHRGIPRRIDYPDGTWQSATVNDAGWVTSVTDENSYVTGYGYDAVGRLASIAYPTGDNPRKAGLDPRGC